MLPTEFIDVARLLACDGATEAALRSAVSRAYYGALHCCNDAVPDQFAARADELHAAGSHRAVIDALERWGRQICPGRGDAQQAARLIGKLKRYRVQADYKIEAEWNVNVPAAILLAERIMFFASSASNKFGA